MSNEVLLSTDIGSDIDDALSLLTILNSGIDLKGIYTVNGDVFSRAQIAKHMVDLSGESIEVAMGESKPLGGNVPPYYFFEEFYVDDKFIDEEETEISRDIVFKPPERVGINPKGLEALANQLKGSKKTIFNIAPMTNIAKLIEKYPEAVKNIERLYIMGCRFAEPEQHEHNVRFDIPSAMKVFESDIPITVIPGELCSEYELPAEKTDDLKSPVGVYVKRMAKGFKGAKTARNFQSEELKFLIEQGAEIDPSFLKNEKDKKKYYEEILLKKDRLLVNLDDPHYAAFEPDEYFEDYYGLIDHLRKFNYSYKTLLTSKMIECVPKDLSIADVYVPYCFLNPEKIQTERTNVTIDTQGYSRKKQGKKHEIVTDLDYNDFKRFLDSNFN